MELVEILIMFSINWQELKIIFYLPKKKSWINKMKKIKKLENNSLPLIKKLEKITKE